MSKIARLELYHVGIPTPAPFYPVWIPGYPMTKNTFTLIKVITDDGILSQPFYRVDGHLTTPNSSGLGFSINQNALRKYDERFLIMDRRRLVWFTVRNRGVKVARELDARRKERKQLDNK